jgi:hypothetical protein
MRVKFDYSLLTSVEWKDFIKTELMEPIREVFSHMLSVKRNPEGVKSRWNFCREID